VERLPAGTHAARGAQVVLGQGLGASLGCASALEGQLDDDGVPGGAATACASEGHDERLLKRPEFPRTETRLSAPP
jgi:hypothetical protein